MIPGLPRILSAGTEMLHKMPNATNWQILPMEMFFSVQGLCGGTKRAFIFYKIRIKFGSYMLFLRVTSVFNLIIERLANLRILRNVADEEK